MKTHLLKWGRPLVTVAIVVGLILFARTINWRETWEGVRQADPWMLLLAAAVNHLCLVIKGVRWWVFLKPIGAESLWLAIRATFAGAGLNNVLVASGGEAARVIFVSRATGSPSAKVLATLALERLFEFVGYLLLLVVAVSMMKLPDSIERLKYGVWAVCVGVAVFTVYLLRRPHQAEIALAPAVGWWAHTKQYGQRFMHTVGGISTPSRFASAALLSVIDWALQVITYHLTAKSVGFEVPLVGTIAAILTVNLGFAIRVTPGNVGLFQMMYAVTTAGFGMDKNQAIAVGFLIQAQQIIPVTLIGIALAPEFIFKKHRPLGEDRSVDEPASDARMHEHERVK